jgi:hypothetical protein
MPIYLLDLDLDGYEDEEERKKACDVFIMDQLDFSASSVKFNRLEDSEEGPSVEQLGELWNICKRFINKYKPSCAESINQVDEINLACSDFVEEICECVGYYEYKKEDEL